MPGRSAGLRVLVRHELAGLDTDQRVLVGSFLAAAPAEHVGAAGPELAASLHLIREGIRDRLPVSMAGTRRPLAVSIDELIAVTETSFYVRGWLRDRAGAVTRLTAVSPEGWRSELLDRCFRHDRPDVDREFGEEPSAHPPFGFIAHFQIGAPSFLTNGWVFEAGTEPGEGVEVSGPMVLRDDRVPISILEDVALGPGLSPAVLVKHVHPAISGHQERRAPAHVDDVVQFGSPSPSPAASLIVRAGPQPLRGAVPGRPAGRNRPVRSRQQRRSVGGSCPETPHHGP